VESIVGHSARMVSSPILDELVIPAVWLAVTVTVIRARRLGAGVAPTGAMVHVRVIPVSGVSLLA